jgi:hypothetical protein
MALFGMGIAENVDGMMVVPRDFDRFAVELERVDHILLP